MLMILIGKRGWMGGWMDDVVTLVKREEKNRRNRIITFVLRVESGSQGRTMEMQRGEWMRTSHWY